MAGGAIDDDDEITAINVTPLVDVTLVLLIIFMVTTSLISNAEGLQVDKPEAASGAKLDDSSVMIVCAADGTVQVDGKTVDGDKAIIEALTDKLVEDRNLQGIVQCDEAAQVGQMVHLIDLMRNAGIKKYAIATKKPEAAGG
ncbi:MAG: biopolymer transporter ExbD [Nannocystaceae bacterium]|nr:biopolymer transporter ExbD [Nannocystaceae bacterium]